MTFVVYIVNWSCYKLIVIDCELIMQIDYDCYYIKFTVFCQLQHTTFII